MFNLSLRVTTEGAPARDVAITPATIIGFERQFQIGLARAFEQDQRFEHMLWLGWDATRRAGHTGLEFDDWVNTVVSIEPAETVERPLADTP